MATSNHTAVLPKAYEIGNVIVALIEEIHTTEPREAPTSPA